MSNQIKQWVEKATPYFIVGGVLALGAGLIRVMVIGL